MDEFGVIALLAASMGLVYSVIDLVTRFRARVVRGSAGDHHELVLTVDGERITIDVGALDQEDPQKLENTVEKVRAVKRRERTPVAA